MDTKVKLAVTIAVILGMAGLAESACLTTDNSIAVQADSGQGNYDCTVLQAPDGTELVDLTSIPDLFNITDPNPVDGSVDWTILPFDDNGTLRTYRIYFGSTNNSGQGKRCNYLYDGLPTLTEDSGLGAEAGTVNNITLCGDPRPVSAVPVESDFITTLGDACTTTVSYEDADVPATFSPDVTIGFTSGVDGETIAACNSGGTSAAQVECAPPPYAQQTPSGDCTAGTNGELPLSCAPVDITGAPGTLEYCWYYENRVCETGVNRLAYCDETRGDNTFIPKTKKNSLEVSIDVFDGSTCYTYYLRGKAYYSSGCYQQ